MAHLLLFQKRPQGLELLPLRRLPHLQHRFVKRPNSKPVDKTAEGLVLVRRGKLIRNAASHGGVCMTVAKNSLSDMDAVDLARKIANIPSGEVPAVIRQMLKNRELSKTVGALDDLLAEQPEHRIVVSKALDKLGLWHCG